MTKLVLKFKKKKRVVVNQYITPNTFYPNSEAETMINETDIDNIFESVCTRIISNIQKSVRKDSVRIIDSVIDHNINISKCNPSSGSSYIKLPKEFDHPKKGLINIQNIDNSECFKWCLIRYLYLAVHHLAIIAKAGKDFAMKPDFKVIKFPVKIETFRKLKKKCSVDISVFGYESTEKYLVFVSGNALKKAC